jgi:hypothetical protein
VSLSPVCPLPAYLLHGKETSRDASLSAVANYILIHDTLQDISLTRQQWLGTDYQSLRNCSPCLAVILGTHS